MVSTHQTEYLTAFQKEDFLGSDLSTITVGSVSYTNAYELDTDVDGANAENLYVVMDNVVQEPDVAFVIHENASSQPRILQFTSSVVSTASIYVVHRGIGSMSMKPPTGSVGADPTCCKPQVIHHRYIFW